MALPAADRKAVKQHKINEFMKWHNSLSAKDKSKFSGYVAALNKGRPKSQPGLQRAAARRLQKAQAEAKPKYRSQVKHGQGNSAEKNIGRNLGDALSSRNPNSIPRRLGDIVGGGSGSRGRSNYRSAVEHGNRNSAEKNLGRNLGDAFSPNNPKSLTNRAANFGDVGKRKPGRYGDDSGHREKVVAIRDGKQPFSRKVEALKSLGYSDPDARRLARSKSGGGFNS